MILVDTGPLVALFDPADGDHEGCVRVLARIEEPVCTTVPVLTEAFHLLGPGRIGSQRLMDFVTRQGLQVRFLDDQGLVRAFELMLRYADQPMDLADASLVVLAETLGLREVFTIDRARSQPRLSPLPCGRHSGSASKRKIDPGQALDRRPWLRRSMAPTSSGAASGQWD